MRVRVQVLPPAAYPSGPYAARGAVTTWVCRARGSALPPGARLAKAPGVAELVVVVVVVADVVAVCVWHPAQRQSWCAAAGVAARFS